METVLPGVFIDVRPEGLIVPGRVTVGNIGIVGTASKGPVDEPVILGSYAQARQIFGAYDAWNDGTAELTLVRALEIAYNHGATTVVAVRVANGAQASSYALNSGAATPAVLLTAASPGTWGDGLSVNVSPAEQDAFIEGETVEVGADMTLTHTEIIESARNRILVNGRSRRLSYDLGDIMPEDLPAGFIGVNRTTGALAFPTGEAPEAGADVIASYATAAAAVQVTVRYGQAEEVFTVVNGNDLIRDISDPVQGSTLVTASLVGADGTGALQASAQPNAFAPFQGGTNGASGANYQVGLDLLLDEEVQIILAAGQDETFGDELDAHCQVASSDAVRRDRIAVVGTQALNNDRSASVSQVTNHTLASDRVVLAAPGITVADNAVSPPVNVTLPGAYAAAAIAGLLSSYSPHISLTNKTLRVGGLEHRYNSAELAQIVRSRVLALESRQGFRIVRGITTATNTAWTQITTRRIVDFAKYGVRSAANPYIGLLNNNRVRGALRATINSFLASMVTDEMLVSYELDVSATREQERQGIVQVVMTLRPTFSIDFIQVTMFLE
ncbi:phage tail sheath subtilisin-like domain-containing protein [Oscillatoria sp. CS-180]|uniref:phage tail sheath C-terminal domain-containing protein n=1 Tax=Oscillatoria sp. CS-180 TaxID=3021720 RepID=UPI00232B1B92|nr:phage tail sheath C-terminal domain-containing protein [Oscillatoria sp. CS-180]MDB9527122.1 phage tail sheath subtilisin-like domain-containing protein [Oscillatoria sp. CS-180]